MLKHSLQFKLSQKLSPQQIQLMKLIQLPTQAFEQRLQEELVENPALENGKEEISELEEAITRDDKLAIEVEFGDLLFSVINYSLFSSFFVLFFFII